MMKNNSLCLWLVVFCLYMLQIANMQAQNDRKCIQDILRIEEMNSLRNDSSAEEKNIYMNYTVKVTNWDDQLSISNVKMYKHGLKMHFFSEQVNIFMDEKEVLLVMPYQRILVLNSGSEEINSYRLTQDFFDQRKELIDSCIVEKIESKGDARIVTLKVDPRKVDENIMITRMVYEYNLATNKILSVRVTYNEDYKIKQYVVIYNDYSQNSAYRFPPLKRQIIDKRGNVLGKYKTYEFVDNRYQGHNKRN